jgi:hypothetical protein
MSFDTATAEIWTDKLGRPAYLIPVGAPVSEDGEGWYADFPGQLPPYEYRIQAQHNPKLAIRKVVFPLAPWTAYDAITDFLLAEGFVPFNVPQDLQCVHGLTASLCADPTNHWA